MGCWVFCVPPRDPNWSAMEGFVVCYWKQEGGKVLIWDSLCKIISLSFAWLNFTLFPQNGLFIFHLGNGTNKEGY